MTMRYASLSVLLSLLFVPALAARASAQTPDEVVEKHLAALGGRAALGKITSRRATCTLTIGTPGGDLAGPCELTYKTPNKSRVHITLDLTPLGAPEKMVIEQKFDGVAGWALNSMQGDTEMTGNQLENMKNAHFPSALLDYKGAGTTLALLPGETLNDRKMVVLQITPKSGSVVKMYLDAETFLTVRTMATVNSPQAGGDIEQVSDVSDYRVVDGVKVPFHVVNSNPLQTGTIVITKIEHNVAIDDAIFKVRAPSPVR